MQACGLFQQTCAVGIISTNCSITHFIYTCDNAVFIIIICKCVCAVSICGFCYIAVCITLIFGRIAYDINAFDHLIILVFTVNHTVGDLVNIVCLTISFNSICFNSILFIVIIGVCLYKSIAVKFLEPCLLRKFIIDILLLKTRRICQPVNRTIAVIDNLICHLVVAVGDFTKSTVAIILIFLNTTGYACC